MTVGRRHTLYAVEIDDTTPVRLPGIENVNFNSEIEARAEATGGAVYPEHVAIHQSQPMADFTTLCPNEVMKQIALAGMNIASQSSGVNLFAYKYADGGSRATGTSHREYKFNSGIIVPQRLTCDHQGDARLTYGIMPTYDGSNAIVVISDNVAVPAAPSDSERLSIGRLDIGGVTFTGIKNVELDFGLNVVREGADSDIHPTHSSIDDGNPRLTIRGIDIEWFKTGNIPLEGKAATHANTTLYLRSRANQTGPTASGYQADGSNVHLKFTMSGLAYIEQIFSSQGAGSAEDSITLVTNNDGTNAPVVITTDSPIT